MGWWLTTGQKKWPKCSFMLHTRTYKQFEIIIKKHPEPEVYEEKRENPGGIGNILPQTVGSWDQKYQWDEVVNCDATTYFWGRNFTISGGRKLLPLLGSSVTWSERFWVVTFRGCKVWVVVISGRNVGGRNGNASNYCYLA